MSCPCCGYCDKCGRSDRNQGFINPYPAWPYLGGVGGYVSQTVTGPNTFLQHDHSITGANLLSMNAAAMTTNSFVANYSSASGLLTDNAMFRGANC